MKRSVCTALALTSIATSAFAFTGIGNPDRGRMLFNSRCAVCHGEDGRGRDGMAANLVDEWYRLAKSDQELARNILEGFQTPGKIYGAGAMPPQKPIDPRQMEDLLTYIRGAFGMSRQMNPWR